MNELASLATWLPALLERVPESTLRERREGCGAFSILEHVWHLHDIDALGYLVRIRRTLAGGSPSLPDLDGDRLAKERRYQERALAPALRAVLRRRRAVIARLRKLKDADFARTATLEGAGLLTLGEILARWRTHDLGHRVEMERLAAELTAP
ncbi:MAG: DinB family protein [Myxococcales bacterium]|nr:DinB family protein [Myxococcales bacterium]